MGKPRLYVEEALEAGQLTRLPSAASHHLCKVLRHQAGDELVVFNGDGYNYAAVIQDCSRLATIEVRVAEINSTESGLHLHLLQGISSGDRMDASLQKSVELGVSSVTPLLCEKGQVRLKPERLEKKMQHWKNVVVAACEQSGRSVLPTLNQPTSLEEWFACPGIGPSQTGMVFDPQSTALIGDTQPGHRHCHLVIGPESGLTVKEIHCCLDNGCAGVSLGPRILRTETAGPAAIAVLQARFGDLQGSGSVHE